MQARTHETRDTRHETRDTKQEQSGMAATRRRTNECKRARARLCSFHSLTHSLSLASTLRDPPARAAPFPFPFWLLANTLSTPSTILTKKERKIDSLLVSAVRIDWILKMAGAPHTFEKTHFRLPTNCSYCGDRIWNWSKSAYQCSGISLFYSIVMNREPWPMQA